MWVGGAGGTNHSPPPRDSLHWDSGAATACGDERLGVTAGSPVQDVPDATHCWFLHQHEVLPQTAETHFKVLFSCLPTDDTQSAGPWAAARAGLDPKEIWDLCGCRCRSPSLAPFSMSSPPSASSPSGGSAGLHLASATAPLWLRTPEPGPVSPLVAAAGEQLLGQVARVAVGAH